MINRNLCKTVLERGGKLSPLLISPEFSKGLGLMNPSILRLGNSYLLNIRNINYTLYHCEGEQLFTSRWGPLSYLHPENDMHLRTFNYMCEINPDTLEIIKYSLTDTSEFDVDPLWDFVGLEDARLVYWDNKLYQCGVRRDTTTNGVGRMEYTELRENSLAKTPHESQFKEISRVRIEAPIDKKSYCEKNWMPVLDMPYHFVKWTNPTEVIKADPKTGESVQVFLSSKSIPNMPDLRGGSQVIRYNNYRIALLHEVNLFNNRLNQKDGTYLHRFIVWDLDWNIVTVSDPFSFMDGEIEFSCGIAFHEADMLLTFGFQDNAAYILRVPNNMINEILGLKQFSYKDPIKSMSLIHSLNKFMSSVKIPQTNILVSSIGYNKEIYQVFGKSYKRIVFNLNNDEELLNKYDNVSFNDIPFRYNNNKEYTNIMYLNSYYNSSISNIMLRSNIKTIKTELLDILSKLPDNIGVKFFNNDTIISGKNNIINYVSDNEEFSLDLILYIPKYSKMK